MIYNEYRAWQSPASRLTYAAKSYLIQTINFCAQSPLTIYGCNTFRLSSRWRTRHFTHCVGEDVCIEYRRQLAMLPSQHFYISTQQQSKFGEPLQFIHETAVLRAFDEACWRHSERDVKPLKLLLAWRNGKVIVFVTQFAYDKKYKTRAAESYDKH